MLLGFWLSYLLPSESKRWAVLPQVLECRPHDAPDQLTDDKRPDNSHGEPERKANDGCHGISPLLVGFIREHDFFAKKIKGGHLSSPDGV